MRRTLFFLLLAVGAIILMSLGGDVARSTAASDSYRLEVLADAPAAYWRAGELNGSTFTDGVGSNNGTYSGAPGFTLGAAGAIWNDVSTAASFDGVRGYAVVPDANALDLTSTATVETWVRRRSSGVFQPLVGKPTNGQSKLENYSLWLNTANRGVAYFGNGTTYVSVSTPAALDTNWHHLVATYNNATARIYLDGALAGTSNSTVQLTPNTNPLYIARSSTGSYYSGVDVDEVAVYPSVLPAARVSAHYAAARVDNEPPVVSLSSPPAGVTTADDTPTFDGSAGKLGGDSATVSVKLYSGSTATGSPLQTLNATRGSNGSFSVTAAALTDGPYVARAEQRDDAANLGLSAVRPFTVDTGPPVAAITQNPAALSNSAAATFAFTADEPSTFECSLDTGSYAACSSPEERVGLSNGEHTFRVRATDGAGNLGPVAGWTWTVDTAAPVTTISDGPAALVASPDASLTFSANEDATYECSLDGGFEPCTSPQDYQDVPDGAHTFSVRATDAAGNTGAAASRSWSVDTTAPSPDLTQPADGETTNDDTPTFAGMVGAHANDLATVTVRVYEGASVSGDPFQTRSATRRSDGRYSVDASPPLPDGTYTAQTSQDDSLGHTGYSAAATFVVDTGADDLTPPTVSLAFPRADSATNDATPAFSGTGGTDPGDLDPITVEIYAGSIVTGDPLETMTADRGTDGAYSVEAPQPLDEGTYVGRASQSDEAGNTGRSSNKVFRVDMTAPAASITGAPPAQSSSSSASFGFQANEAGAVFECALDAEGFSPCTTPKAYSGLADGSHNFLVRATDPAGNTGAPESVTWTVDTVAPVASIASGPSGTISDATAEFGLSADEAGSTFRCRLDGQAFAACDSPAAYAGLADGTHVFQVHARDGAGNDGPVASRTWTVDTTGPSPTLDSPAAGSSSAWPEPSFTGTAGTATGDVPSLTVKLYSGTSTVTPPVETMTVAAAPDGSYKATVAAFLRPGTYTARTMQVDTADNVGYSAAHTFSITDPVVLAAGDIASCEDSGGDEATSDILMAHPDAVVAPLGDTAYVDGTPAEFANCYQPSWGRAFSRTFPTVGDHEYATPNASGYFNYFRDRLQPFGAAAVDPTRGMYSYDLGAWHVVVLNSNCVQVGGCTAGSPMEQWLRADLAAHPSSCTLAYWHHPRFSSGGQHGSDTRMAPFFDALYDNGVELVLNGNEHVYERFAPQSAEGVADPGHGVRQFTVGTGGYFFYQFGTPLPNSEARSTNVYGVVKLSLHSNGYDWQFLPEAGRTYSDSGSSACHGTPPPPPPPPAGTPTVRASSSNTANAATSISLAKPAGTTAGDVLVATASHQVGANRNMTAPAGWTAVPNTNVADGNNARIHAWYKVATALEPLSYSFPLTGGSGQDISGGIIAIEGADAAAPINASAGQANSSQSKNVTAPSVTTTIDNALIMFGGTCSAAVSYSPPSGFTEHWDRSSSGTYKVSTEVATKGQGVAGATGPVIATVPSSCRGAGINVAIAPAPGTG